MTQLYSNNGISELAAPILLADTSILLKAGDGALFDSPTGSDYELLTLEDAGVVEIVKVTARATDALTVVRAQEGTIASDFPAATAVEGRITAGTLDSFSTFDERAGPIVIGNAALSDLGGTGAIAIGDSAYCDGTDSVAIGTAGYTAGSNNVSMGLSVDNAGDSNVSIGNEARVINSTDDSVAIGHSAWNQNAECVGIGFQSLTSADYAVAIGSNSTANASRAISIGNYANASGAQSIAIGYSISSTSTDSVLIGTQVDGGIGKTDVVAIGTTAKADATSAVAIGDSSDAGGIEAIAIGHLPSSSASGSIGIGTSTVSVGTNGIAIGSLATTFGTNDINIGYNSSSTAGSNSIAIGGSATTSTNGIAIGSSTLAPDSGITIGKAAKGNTARSIVMGTQSSTFVVTDAIVVAGLASNHHPFNWSQGDEYTYGNTGITSTLTSDPIDLTGGSTWAATTAYNHGDVVKPTVPNGYQYVWYDDAFNIWNDPSLSGYTPSSSGASEPTWPTAANSTVYDNAGTWLTVDNSGYTLNLADDFMVEEVMFVAYNCSGITAQANISVGNTGALTSIINNQVTVGLTADKSVTKWTPAQPVIVPDIVLSIDTLATGTQMLGNFIVKGFYAKWGNS